MGNFADVEIFGKHRITDRASYQQPAQGSTSIDASYVNAVLASEGGETVDAYAGAGAVAWLPVWQAC